MPLRLLVVDDNEPIRGLVRTVLGVKTDWQVCGEATNGREAVEKVRELAPDVVVLDLIMPEMNGFEAATIIRREAPSTKIVLLSAHDLPATVTGAHADAFVSKDAAARELIATIQRITVQPKKSDNAQRPGRAKSATARSDHAVR